jgi:hypothetical protein
MAATGEVFAVPPGIRAALPAIAQQPLRPGISGTLPGAPDGNITTIRSPGVSNADDA